MSLTTNIQYDEEWKAFFKGCIPTKTDFNTISGHLPFSNEYEELVKYSLSNRHYSCIVGAAFDYIARWVVAKNVIKDKDSACKDLIAECALEICTDAAREHGIDMKDTYRKAISKCKNFINGDGEKNEIIDVAILFAKLEQIFRSHAKPWDVDITYLFKHEKEIVEDLGLLYDVFEDKFIESGLVKENSDVVYNPVFGVASVICGGADADIFIDGTLYDFKCTRKHGYAWNEVAQILGYYLLDNVAKKNGDTENYLNEYEINRIAFYRARYGEIEYVDVSKDAYQTLIEQFEVVMGKDTYRNYLIQYKMKVEEEKRKKAEAQEMYEINFKRWTGLKQLLGLGEGYEECLKECKTDSERQSEIRWLLRVWSNSLIEFKLDGNRIRRIMSDKNITEKEVSQYTEKTTATVKRWIKEESIPRAGSFLKLLEILDCKKEDIIKKCDF